MHAEAIRRYSSRMTCSTRTGIVEEPAKMNRAAVESEAEAEAININAN